MTIVPFGLLPLAFAGDEHLVIGGVTKALLPPDFAHIQQKEQWSATNWGDFAANTLSAPWSGHWQGLPITSFGSDASPARQAQLSTCQPGCTIHSETQHTAERLLRRLAAFPAEFVQQWQPTKTDGVLFWLSRQVAFEASSPGSPNSLMASSFQPTRQDAELLRICMCRIFWDNSG